jgi:hypothetical protein
MGMQYPKISDGFKPISTELKNTVKLNNNKCVFIKDFNKFKEIYGQVFLINDFSYGIKKIAEGNEIEVLSFSNLEKIFTKDKKA